MEDFEQINGNSLLTIHFTGERLDNASMPLYDLGQALIAVQRIVHKTYLFHENRLGSLPKLSYEERQRLALQIAERRKGSDIFSFMPFLANGFDGTFMSALIASAFTAISFYALQNLIPNPVRRVGQTNNRVEPFTEASNLIDPVSISIYQKLNETFDIEELNTLCFSLGIEPDQISGNNRSVKARELVRYTERHGMLDSLIAKCEAERPHIDWREANRVHAVSIYQDVSQLLQPIVGVSKVYEIEIYTTHAKGEVRNLRLGRETRMYLAHVENEYWLGDEDVIEGQVVDISSQDKSIYLQVWSGRRLKVLLSPDDFDVVRYEVRDNKVSVRARPRYSFRHGDRWPMEFIGEQIIKIE